LELVDTFLGSADFFQIILEHLSHLPDVDRMLSAVALVPKIASTGGDEPTEQYVRVASKGIESLISIKTVLSALPSLVGALQEQLAELESRHTDAVAPRDADTVVTGRSSLLIGLGGNNNGNHLAPPRLERNHLLSAIIQVLANPELSIVLRLVTEIFTESTTHSRNALARQHQECFALRDRDDGVMSIMRRAYLANVDDIYKQADACAELYNIQVTVRYTTARGYFLAVPVCDGADLPLELLHPTKIGRSITCTTKEVASLNLRARDLVRDLLVMTHERMQEVMTTVRDNHYDPIASLCDAIALLDLCHSFADTVTLSQLLWCRPFVSDQSHHDSSATTDGSVSVDSGTSLMIRKGRYPINVSESGRALAGDGPSDFVANDTFAADGKNFTVISGINGSGKSTYLKQIAIIVILAHCGSYVPAEQASIPIRDSLCTRIGNADDQEHNMSTFMQEMKEMAFICNTASSRSLILLDELGRATSNEDGVSLAWSVAEYLLKKRAMTFFVTHYPQLNRLADVYPNVNNVHLDASVTRGSNASIHYTHRVKTGACNVATDYGVELAAACGWMNDVVEDARSMETIAQARLPGDALCQQSIEQEDAENLEGEQHSDSHVRAYQTIQAIQDTLRAMYADTQLDSVRAFREVLIHQQEHLAPCANDSLLKRMDQLLFREPRNEEVEAVRLGDRGCDGDQSRDDDESSETSSDGSITVTSSLHGCSVSPYR
jgi:DNA mismatch repair protein MSH4